MKHVLQTAAGHVAGYVVVGLIARAARNSEWVKQARRLFAEEIVAVQQEAARQAMVDYQAKVAERAAAQ